jgi:hypothetical protein
LTWRGSFIAIAVSLIAFFAKARQPKTRPRIITSHQSPALLVNNANQRVADQGNVMAEVMALPQQAV